MTELETLATNMQQIKDIKHKIATQQNFEVLSRISEQEKMLLLKIKELAAEALRVTMYAAPHLEGTAS